MMHDITWSKTEKQIARKAYAAAYERECADLIEKVRAKALAMDGPEALWDMQDFLTLARRDVDEKYDYRYSVLISVFGLLASQSWLDINDLGGLSEDKISRIETIVNYRNE